MPADELAALEPGRAARVGLRQSAELRDGRGAYWLRGDQVAWLINIADAGACPMRRPF
jgi:hypothetical protein